MREIYSVRELDSRFKYFIYGSGKGGRSLSQALARAGYRVAGFVDSFKAGVCDGLPVILLDSFMGSRSSEAQILVASEHVFEIGRSLYQRGVTDAWNANPLVSVLQQQERSSPWQSAKQWGMRRLAPFLAGMVRHMAETGVGTDACLRQGCLPMRVHFYTPIPDIEDLKARQVWARKSDLAGIDFRPDAQLAFLDKLGRDFGAECRWPDLPTGDAASFYTGNPHFSFGCAAGTHAIIRHLKPRNVIEIGSGFSTRVIAAALRANQALGAVSARYTVVDPYPSPFLGYLPEISELIRRKAELLEPSVFDKLEAGDVLFIDSSHTVRIGGDVNFLILDVLPRLKPGVHIHIHDIPMPYEYAEIYTTDPLRRLLWTESYLLQSFLAHNSRFRITLGMNWIMTDRRAAFSQAFPCDDPDKYKQASHSMWIETFA